MPRAVVLLGLLALAACGRPATQAALAPDASHHWSAVSGQAYTYYPDAHAEGGRAASTPTIVHYLGRGADGAYVVSEGEGAALMRASCILPCDEARMYGQGYDHTGPLGGDSVTRSALDDAVNGRLEVSVLPARPAGS